MKFIKKHDDCRGSAAIEMAMLAPLFLALIFALIKGGIMFNAWSTLQWCANNAAHDTAISSTPTEDHAQATINRLLTSQNLNNASVTTSSFSCGTGTCIHLNASLTVDTGLGFLSNSIKTVTLNAQSNAPISDLYSR